VTEGVVVSYALRSADVVDYLEKAELRTRKQTVHPDKGQCRDWCGALSDNMSNVHIPKGKKNRTNSNITPGYLIERERSGSYVGR
jgi:hypothetical protein